MLHLILAIAMQQAPAQAAQLRVIVAPTNPTVTAGDSLRLTASVQDAAGKVVPNARVRWLGGSFEGRVDSTGLFHAGSRGTVVIYAVPSVEGSPPGQPTRVAVRVLAPP